MANLATELRSVPSANAGRAMPRRPQVEVKDISPALGAEITGLDIRSPELDARWEQVTRLLEDRHVLLFRDQEIDEVDLERFARRFGELEASVSQKPDGTMAGPVSTITNFDAEGKPTFNPHRSSNYFWHADKLFRPTGSAMVFLYGLELPPSGGDTQFANMVLAYEGLSAVDRQLADSLRVLHSFEYMRDNLMKRPLSPQEKAVVPAPHAHPLVRTDPHTGRKSLVLGMYAGEVVGMPLEEGRALIQRFEEHATHPQFMHTHQWRPGDFLVWNNLTMLHRALPNYAMDKVRRVMMRCGVRSDQVLQ